MFIFFFKQKTAYEIGLGIPAEPLFRSRFKIVVIDIQITLKQMLRDFIGIRVNRAKKSGMVNITSSSRLLEASTMKSRRGFAIQRLMNAMRQAHADGWFIVFDTLTDRKS